MKYKIFRIEEQMYGCEEPPADQPILVDVVLEGADGTRRMLPYPDDALRRGGMEGRRQRRIDRRHPSQGIISPKTKGLLRVQQPLLCFLQRFILP